MHRFKYLFILFIAVLLTYSPAGCGGVLSEKEVVIAAFNAGMIGDDTRNNDSTNVFWLSGGVHWNILHWNIKLTKHVRDVRVDGDHAMVKAVFTLNGEYQISVNGREYPETKMNFSSNEVTLQLVKTGERWHISGFPELILKSNHAAPSISNFKFVPGEKEVSPGALISISADIHCGPLPQGVRHVALYALARHLGIDPATRAVKLTGAMDLNYQDSMFIQSDARTGDHYGGLYAAELVDTGTNDRPDYKLYLTLYITRLYITF